MWSGSAENVPSGWALCNGSNGTPDLRNRFVIGAGNTYVVKSTGGEASHTLTLDEIPAHDHVATSSQYTHTHEVSLENKRAQSTNSTSSDRKAWNSPPQGSLQKRTDYIANDTHNHTITINKTGSGKPHNNLPPYFALCFIMKL
jgi:microcystin-dependent protein